MQIRFLEDWTYVVSINNFLLTTYEFSGDNLRLEPLSGDLKPGAHCNIKMTLIPSRFPTHFEGEIQCSIDWDRDAGDKLETRSVATMTQVNDTMEYLFLRLKKRSKIVSKMNIVTETLLYHIFVFNRPKFSWELTFAKVNT